MVNYSNIFVNEGLSYEKYRDLVDSLLAENKTTGSDHSEALLNYSKLNVQRMNRVYKTAVLSEALVSSIKALKNRYRFLVISEGWCGDAAQLVPLFQKMAELVPAHIELKLVLRDTNLPLIDAHLTNGGRAIPKLLVLDDAGVLVAEWGPRPHILQLLLNEWKLEVQDVYALAEKLHFWYAKDKTLTSQEELLVLIGGLEKNYSTVTVRPSC